ncbi:MAG: ArsC family reductase [Oxalobacteraceae bacterium]|jgi:arsenate reductase|nr:ArsC family reductase [Oxalobacteraceae bacterium]
MPITVYGIPNCGSVQKARTWLDTQGLPYEFHDFKKAGLSKDIIAAWLKVVTWEILVNKKGTTWRGLSESTKASITTAASATQLMLENPSVIKRPVLCQGKNVLVGFDASLYEEQLR